MKYYAYINESKIATRVYEMPVEMLESQGFIEITKEQYEDSMAENEASLIGMKWDANKRIWIVVEKFYYAVIIEKKFRKEVTEEELVRYFVREVVEEAEEVSDPSYIPIEGLDDVKVGQIYDPETAGFRMPDFVEEAFVDTDQISVGGENIVLTDKLVETEESIKDLEAKINTVKDQVENIEIPEVTATSILEKLKTVDGASSGIDADLLDGKDSTYFATKQDVSNLTTAVNGKAPSSHTHDYSATYAPIVHGHSEYALANHGHARQSNIIVGTAGVSSLTINTSYTEAHNQSCNVSIDSQLGGWNVSNGYLIVPKAGNYLIEMDGDIDVLRGALGSNGSSYNLIWVTSQILKNSAISIVNHVTSIKPYHCSNAAEIYMPNTSKIVYLNAGDKINVNLIEQCKSASMTVDCFADIHVRFRITEV